jgi:hypothetical protein
MAQHDAPATLAVDDTELGDPGPGAIRSMPRLQWPAVLISIAAGGSRKRIGTVRPEGR